MGNMGRSDQFSQPRRDAFAAEGLRRRAAMRQRGVPGIPAPAGGGMMNVAPSSLNTMENRMPAHPQFRPGIDAPLGSGGMTTMEHRTPANPGYRPGVDNAGPLRIVPLGGSPASPAPTTPYQQYQPPSQTLPPPRPLQQVGPNESMAAPMLHGIENRLQGVVANQGGPDGFIPNWRDTPEAKLAAQRTTAFGQSQFRMGVPELSTRQQELGQRADAAAIGQPFGQRVPIEQQGFAGQQMRLGSRGGPRQFVDGAVPSQAERDQYGLARPLGTGNITPMPGVASMDPNNRMVGTMPGGSVVMDVGGRRVVMGSSGLNAEGKPQTGMGAASTMLQRGAAENLSPQNLTRSALREAQMRINQSPAFAANVARKKEQNAATRARNTDLRALAQARRSGVKPDSALMGRVGKGGGAMAGGPAIPVDVAVNSLAANHDPQTWGMLGQDPTKAEPDAIIGSLDTPTYRGMSGGAKQKIQDDVENIIAADPEMDPILAEEMRGLARGDKDARKKAAAKRRQNARPEIDPSARPFAGSFGTGAFGI